MENINKLDSVDQVEPLDKFVKADDKGLFEIIGTSEESIDRLSSAPYSYWRETFKTLFKNKVAILSRLSNKKDKRIQYIISKGKVDNHYWVRDVADR